MKIEPNKVTSLVAFWLCLVGSILFELVSSFVIVSVNSKDNHKKRVEDGDISNLLWILMLEYVVTSARGASSANESELVV